MIQLVSKYGNRLIKYLLTYNITIKMFLLDPINLEQNTNTDHFTNYVKITFFSK